MQRTIGLVHVQHLEMEHSHLMLLSFRFLFVEVSGKLANEEIGKRGPCPMQRDVEGSGIGINAEVKTGTE